MEYLISDETDPTLNRISILDNRLAVTVHDYEDIIRVPLVGARESLTYSVNNNINSFVFNHSFKTRDVVCVFYGKNGQVVLIHNDLQASDTSVSVALQTTLFISEVIMFFKSIMKSFTSLNVVSRGIIDEHQADENKFYGKNSSGVGFVMTNSVLNSLDFSNNYESKRYTIFNQTAQNITIELEEELDFTTIVYLEVLTNNTMYRYKPSLLHIGKLVLDDKLDVLLNISLNKVVDIIGKRMIFNSTLFNNSSSVKLVTINKTFKLYLN